MHFPCAPIRRSIVAAEREAADEQGRSCTTDRASRLLRNQASCQEVPGKTLPPSASIPCAKGFHPVSGGRAASRNAISLANLPRDSASSRSLFPHGGGGGRHLSFMAPLFFQASSRKSSFLSGFTGHLWGGIMKTDGICPGMGRAGHGLLPPGSQVPPGARLSGLKGNSPIPAFPSPPSLELGITLLASP